MSQADELLMTLAEGDAETDTVVTVAEPHIVIGKDRRITVPEQLKRIAVQYDHDVETVTFDCPRYCDDGEKNGKQLDMADTNACKVYINYKVGVKIPQRYKAQNVRVDEDDDSIMHFEWTISRNVTETAGTVQFLVCVKKSTTDDTDVVNHWNSEPNSDLYVSPGMETEDQDEEIARESDIVTQLLAAKTNAEMAATNAKSHAEQANIAYGDAQTACNDAESAAASALQSAQDAANYKPASVTRINELEAEVESVEDTAIEARSIAAASAAVTREYYDILQKSAKWVENDEYSAAGLYQGTTYRIQNLTDDISVSLVFGDIDSDPDAETTRVPLGLMSKMSASARAEFTFMFVGAAYEDHGDQLHIDIDCVYYIDGVAMHTIVEYQPGFAVSEGDDGECSIDSIWVGAADQVCEMSLDSAELIMGTPVKGVDYWTEEDKAEIIDEVEGHVDAQIEEISEFYRNNCANPLIGSASGEVVRVDDVSPLEHTVETTVRSKNLFNGELLVGIFERSDFYLQSTTPSVYRSFMVYVHKGTYTISFSKAVNVIRLIADGVYSMINNALGVTTYSVEVKTDGFIGISFRDAVSVDTAWDDTTTIQLELGTEATEYTPYVNPQEVTVTRCGKNLIPQTAPTQTGKGITFTVNADGSVTCNGTATANAVMNLTENYKLPIGTYIMNGCPSTGGETTYRLQTNKVVDGTAVTGCVDTGSGAILRITEDCQVYSYIVVLKDTTVSNVTFYPMIRISSDTDDTYEPANVSTYIPYADGTVPGVRSVAPTMTMFTDTKEGAIIDLDYNRDINRIEAAQVEKEIGDISSALDAIIDIQNTLIGG